ncbi:MAG: ribosomal-processing cysteine protease Prp [Spirochaetes bacterium]|nr:ribosomal-processing cysteine protease Prp [Spirochaetota bacterium]
MIKIQVVLYSNGCLKSLKADGHSSKGKKGENIPCSIVSAVLKTCAKLIYLDRGTESDGDAVSPGNLRLKVDSIEEDRILWVKGITDFLISTLKEVDREYPDILEMCIKDERQLGG